jgi:hypothetical protein
MKKIYINRKKLLLIGLVLVSTVWFLIGLPLYNALAFPVSELPPGNLVFNPWFRRLSDPTLSGLDGWIDAAGPNKYWSTSQKESNPSPEIILSGVCGFEPVYCGTGARLSAMPGQSGGIGVPGKDAYLYQVVTSNSAHRRLQFFAHWVSHKIDPAEVTIYGGNSNQGPWTAVWIPFHIVEEVNEGPEDVWTMTDFMETTLTKGFPYYKLEIHARLPSSEGSGFKISGIYFSTVLLNDLGTPIPPPNYRFFNYLPAVGLNP